MKGCRSGIARDEWRVFKSTEEIVLTLQNSQGQHQV